MISRGGGSRGVGAGREGSRERRQCLGKARGLCSDHLAARTREQEMR